MSNKSATQDPLISFGLEFIDAETGGLIRNKLYLLHGPLSSWKTVISLYFIYEALRNDRRAVYVTSQDPEAVILQADRVGIGLRPFLADGRLTLLTFQPRISQQLELLSDYQRIFLELEHLAGDGPIDRVVFDPIEVLVGQENRSNVLPSTRLLIDALKETGYTVLCIIDESVEPHLQVILKEFVFLSFGAFQLTAQPDNRLVFRFQKVIWNPQAYQDIPLTMANRHGVRILEPVEAKPAKPRLVIAADGERGAPPAPVPLPRVSKLLLVDDDSFYHEMLVNFLGRRYQVDLMRDSVEALSRLLDHSYDAIVLNMNMPRVHGRELCLRIRQHRSGVPILAFSNRLKRDSDVAGILRVGADMFLSRPMAFNQVKASIDAVLRRPPNPSAFAQTLEYIQLLNEDPHALRGIPEEDPGTGLKSLQYFEERMRREVEKARVGEYRFSLVGYHITSSEPGFDLEPVLWEAFRRQVREVDLVTRYSPGIYLTFLDECLEPGVKRVNDRLRKAVARGATRRGIHFRYATAAFPADGEDYDDLARQVVNELRAYTPKLKRLL